MVSYLILRYLKIGSSIIHDKFMENKIQRKDTISELPDELLLIILSSLPSKDAIATSVLSKRWRSLWKEVKLYMYDGNFRSRSYSKFLLFISTRSSVEKLQIKLNPNIQYKDIKPLVNIALSRSLRELRIDMFYDSLKLPKSLYMFSSQLETLILERLSLVDVLPSNVSFTFTLKRLHLLSVKFSSDESVKTLLRICSSLEDLVVRRSSYTNVGIFTICVPTLRSLSIDNSSGKSRPRGVHGFVINVPSLRCFSIRDSFSNYLQFDDMPQLVKASVNIVYDQPDKFLGSLASTQYLSLCSVTSQTTYPPSSTSFLYLDHLELCSCSAGWWNLLTRVLNDSPRLRVLKLKLSRKHCVQFTDAMEPWNRPVSVPQFLSSYLEIFEWRQYNGTDQEREAAKYILANASRLKKATFYSESVEKHGMLMMELESVVRHSKTCQFVFD